MDFNLEKTHIKYYNDLVPIVTDSNVMKNVQKGKNWDKEYLKKHLIESQKYWDSPEFNQKKDLFIWIIVINNKAIGYLRWKKDTNYKLRIFIDNKYQNKGIGTEAVKLSIQKLVKYYRERYLYAEIHEDNIISEKMLKKIGFEFNKYNKTNKFKLKVYRFDLFFGVFPILKLFVNYSDIELLNKLKNYKPEIVTRVHDLFKNNNIKFLLKKRFNEKFFKRLNDEYIIYKFNYGKQKNLFNITDLFSESCRNICKYSFSKYSPYEYLKNNKEKIKNELQRNNKIINRENIREEILKNTMACTNFKVLFVISILNYFKPKSWLDLSAGWGDRLIGAIVYDIDFYCGIDPSGCMNKIYYKIINKLAPNKKNNYKIIKSGSENLKLNRTFDFIFTSPPFFDFEDYINEEEQSMQQFKTYELWMKNFMFKSIENGWNVLIDNGIFALYIPYKHNNKDFFIPVNNYIIKFLNGKYIGNMYFYYEDNNTIRNLYVWKKN